MLEKFKSASCLLGAIQVLFQEALGFSLKTFDVKALPIKELMRRSVIFSRSVSRERDREKPSERMLVLWFHILQGESCVWQGSAAHPGEIG